MRILRAMCTICGCDGGHPPLLDHAHGHAEGHGHAHAPLQPVPHDHRVLALAQDILGANQHVAGHVRQHLAEQHTLALNLVSSPGSGKTTLLVETVQRLRETGGVARPVAVVEGDQQTSLDADRIRATGTPAVQVNTGQGCHLDARMVHDALHHLPALPHGVLLIENVGNLVCPAGFDLGEHAKVLLWSVTEGEDKPLKYPDMFAAAGLVLMTKCDLLPHLRFDMDRAVQCLRQVNPDAPLLRVSASSGEGLEAWLDWITQRCASA
ncbi:MAG: hydrogenase nickel incorporation protein HypB [Proteobacteria bacterium]|nr:hydrogenase nickel incorporation protein HypB [Pseudomonadota bacterium]